MRIRIDTNLLRSSDEDQNRTMASDSNQQCCSVRLSRTWRNRNHLQHSKQADPVVKWTGRPGAAEEVPV